MFNYANTLQFSAHCCGRVAREEMFDVGQRPDVPDILIVITDGMFDDSNATWIEAMKTRARNISIIGVSISALLFSLKLTPLSQSFSAISSTADVRRRYDVFPTSLK